MPQKGFQLLIDYSHGEILNLSDFEYQRFAELLNQLGCKITVNYSNKIDDQLLKDIDVLILGCPVNHYILEEEIKAIIDFVIGGGNLLVISEYGGDSVQKTNLNDLTKNFGIYFENTIVRSNKNPNSSSLPIVKPAIQHVLTKNINEIILGGTCSIRIAKDAFAIFSSGDDMWIEIYDDLNNVWIKSENQNVPLIACITYGQGKVVAFGDIDIFSNHHVFGINSLDNNKLLRNIFSWFNQPVTSENTIDWLLGQTSIHREDIFQLKELFNSMQQVIEKLNRKVNYLEESNTKISRILVRIINTINPPELWVDADKINEMEEIKDNEVLDSIENMDNIEIAGYFEDKDIIDENDNQNQSKYSNIKFQINSNKEDDEKKHHPPNIQSL
ncbi:MAG: DUF4350 domain-containing protein [Promethearchaeota archaeon]